ncbi:MAG: lytic murein transglycosylase [Mesorhizobium sp.]|nr:MAG: lytic murein transglycosylase [Mesorhizobium sp.]
MLRAPLWPAGHLPHEGGDQMSSRLSPISNVLEMGGALKLLISPLVGEMPGKAEGGAKDRYFNYDR